VDLFPLIVSEAENSMGTTAIRSFKSHVGKDEAVRTFSSRGLSAIYWRMRSGPLQRIADAYVPFWIYKVRYEMARGTATRLFALDAVRGALDLFEFPRIPGDDEMVVVQTRNQLQPRLDEKVARELLREKVLRLIFQQGFFKLRALKLEIERVPVELHMPYWLGFYGGGEMARCRVMDAVRRRIEGAKASAFFEQWLAA
jgi:hypothetical protein